MKLTYDPADDGIAQGYHKPGFDDSKWRQVATYGNTLSAQGLPDTKSIMWYRTSINVPVTQGRLSLFFTEVDGQAVSVYIDGHEAASIDKEARRRPFEVDVTDALEPGPNVVAVKVDHRKITELSLGGIVRPILLIEKPRPR
jgi:beta-galactosidase